LRLACFFQRGFQQPQRLFLVAKECEYRPSKIVPHVHILSIEQQRALNPFLSASVVADRRDAQRATRLACGLSGRA
jgi:hypothetical protein